MMRGFTWTPALDRQLRELRRDGASLPEIARALRCDVEHVRQRAGDMIASRVEVTDVAKVPRPVAVRRAGLIDLSKAPSAMEARFRGGKA